MERSVGDEGEAGAESAMSRDARIADLIDECLAAASEGRADAFIAEHPEFAADLRAALVGFEFIDRANEALSKAATRADEPQLTGTLGDFRLVREVGRGGMGVVYEAEQISLGRRVALKVLPFAAVLDERQLQRFRNEAQAAALLHHTNIVPVHAVGTERGVHYYAMQFIEGRTLADVIGELRAAAPRTRTASAERARERRPSRRAPGEAPAKPPSSAEAAALTGGGTTETPDYCRAVARLGVQAAEALDHAHENGVIHRDIKPANLMVDARGHLWVADFGLARSRTTTNLTMTGALIGTLRYMSPEQATGKRVTIDHRTDVYSLGVTLIEALTLEPAFPGDDAHAVIRDISSRDPERPHRINPAVSAALENIVMKAVAKDAELRYATAREMADDLHRYLDDKPVLARRPPVLDRAALWAKRHRAAVVAAAAILVVAVVALGAITILIAAKQKTTANALSQSKRDAARIEEALGESQRSATLAEANFQEALAAVDQMLVRVGDEGLQGVPGLEPVRRKLLADAAAFYRGFLAARGDDPALGLESARAYLRIGRIYESLAQYDAAQQMLDNARALLVALAPEDGPWSPVAEELIQVDLARGDVLDGRSRTRDAISAFEHVVALAGRHARESPGRADVGLLLSRASRCLGRALVAAEDYARAREVLAEAIARHELLLAGSPDDVGLHVEAARLYEAVVALAFDTDDVAGAETAQMAALAHWEKDPTAVAKRAAVHAHLGQIHFRLGRAGEAESDYRAALDAYARLEKETPQSPKYALYMARYSGMLGVVRGALARAAEARESHVDAMSRYDQIFARFENAPEVVGEAARDLVDVADLLNGRDRIEDAEGAYRKALKVLRARAQAGPRSEAAQEDLVAALNALALLLVRKPARDEAIATLREAAQLGEELTSRPDASPSAQQNLAQSLNNLAEMLDAAGESQQRLDALRRAIAAERGLVARSASVPKYRCQLAGFLSNWGRELVGAGELDDANSALEESVSIWEALLREGSDASSLQAELSRAINVAADVSAARGRSAEAEARYRRAVDLMDELLAKSPHDGSCLAQSAAQSRDLAAFLRTSKRPDDAEPAYRQAIERAAEAAAEDAKDVQIRTIAAGCCLDLAAIQRAAGRPAEAEPRVRDAVRFGVEIADLEPSPENRGMLLASRHKLGEILFALGRKDDAERELRTSVELARKWDAQDHAAYSKLLGKTLALLGTACAHDGKTRAAIEALQSAIESDPGAWADGDLVYLLSDGPDATLRDSHRAVEVARRAVASDGENKDAWNQLGMALSCDGQAKDALDAYAKSRGLGYEEDGSDWIYEALAQARLGDLRQARQLFDKTVAWLATSPRADDENLVRRRAEVAALLGISTTR